MDELERLKQLISGVVTIPNSQPATGNVNVNATTSTRPGGPLMADRVPVLKGSKKVLIANEKNKMDNDLQRLLEEAGMREAGETYRDIDVRVDREFIKKHKAVDERRDAMLGSFEAELDELIEKSLAQAQEIGGQFRSPGIFARIRKILKDKVRKI